jgi:hypothetical protein
MKNLQHLWFHHTSALNVNLKSEVKNLQHLETIDFWGADIQYISPELFKLPNLRRINLAYARLNMDKEILKALEDWAEKPGNSYKTPH